MEQVAKKVAKAHVKNHHNVETVKAAVKADAKSIINAHIVRIVNHHVRNRHSAEAVKQAAKHRVSQAVKPAHKQTPHLQHRRQLQFHRKSKAATQLLFSGERQATAIYRDIYFKKRPTAERGHRFIKVHREASRTLSQSAQVRFNIVLRLTTVTA